jgi:hypothetical protein
VAGTSHRAACAGIGKQAGCVVDVRNDHG